MNRSMTRLQSKKIYKPETSVKSNTGRARLLSDSAGVLSKKSTTFA